MPFSEEFLQALTRQRVLGDFPPFTLGSQPKIENYIRKIVAELQRNRDWLIAADFNHKGSGYASYVEIAVARKNKSATVGLPENKLAPYAATGLQLYVSRLAPYWFYGGSDWLDIFDKGRHCGGSYHVPAPDYHVTTVPAHWQADCQRVEAVLASFRYGLLTPAELEQPAPTSIAYIPTVLADPPYRVFDCFFYWLD